ncbi:hypothetical protein [Caldalkalibacillus mannanilyticus]|uniref:hypothetical protein n=1 Tax=Caldalkalibacillus mannanilyticus TaxID=1418 RepID=UPI00046A2B51|nr:hypothetical protein [Caldalkalibacillus mannanilyticus]
MRRWFLLLIMISVLVVSGCHQNKGELPEASGQGEKEGNEVSSASLPSDILNDNLVQEEDKQGAPNEEEVAPAQEQKEKVVTVGVAGFEKDVTLVQYNNEWLSIWYNPVLQLKEEKDTIQFHTGEDVYFQVKHIEEKQAHLVEMDHLIQKFTQKGYELLNRFETEGREGWGYIFYSYEDRTALDVYVLEGESSRVMVEFLLPDQLADKYMNQFEYMIKTIDILS